MDPENLTRELARFAAGFNESTAPDEVIEHQKESLTDAIGVLSAATSIGEGCQTFVELALAEGGEGPCLVLGTDRKTTPTQAALANGSFGHAADFEDSHGGTRIHPNAVSIPAVLACAQYVGGVPGRQLLAALALGSEMSIRIALGPNEDLAQYGFYMPPVHEALGASFGCGAILGLDEDQMMDALTLAMNQAIVSSELVASKDSVMRSVRDGFSARAAVTAALLAKNGCHARFEHALEGKNGYYRMYAYQGGFDANRVLEGLGETFECTKIAFKPWPSCLGTHTSIQALDEIMREQGLGMDDIEHIDVTVSSMNDMLINPREAKYHPQNAINGKFSIPFTMATMAKYRTVTLDSYTPERLNDPDLVAFMQRIDAHAQTIDGSDTTTTCLMKLTAKDGRTFDKRVDASKGRLENPLTAEERKTKFDGCMKLSRRGYTPERSQQIFETIQKLDTLASSEELMDLL